MTNHLSDVTSSTHGPGFAIEAFSMTGHHEGSGWWNFDQLSENWIGTCRELIDHFGPNFDHSWTGALQQVRTRLTSTYGAATVTIFINDRSAASILILLGADPSVETSVAQMFVDALRSAIPEQLLGDDHNFSSVLSLEQRPVMMVVPFFDRDRTDSDGDIVRELSWHFAAAVLQSWSDRATH